MKKELTLKEKEKKFKRLARKSKFYGGIWGFRILYPLIFSFILLVSLAPFSVPIWLVAVLVGLPIVDAGLCFFDKGLINYLTYRKIDKVDEEYYKLGEELAYFIKGEDGKYYNRAYLQENKKDPMCANLLQKLVERQTFKDPKKELMYEIEKDKNPEPKLGYVLNGKSITAFEIKEKHKEQKPIDEKDIYGKDL